MKNTYSCPICKKEFDWDDESDATIVRCPKCNEEMLAPKALLPKGAKIADYEIIKRIGIGGMGEIYLALQTSMQRLVALKILHEDLAKDNAYIQRFLHEVRMLAAVEHPSIVRAIEAGQDKGICFLAMSYVDGTDLKHILDDGKIFPEIEAFKVIRSVAQTLKYVWEKHAILHRDVKPANIMLDKNSEVRLLDLGISKSVKENVEITRSGMMVGSPQYISPEQAKSAKDIDFRADIYSLGATLYHMLTGSPPFDKENPVEIIAAHISEPVPDPRKKNKKISAKTVSLINRMMAKKKEERFSSWQELISAIDDILAPYENKTDVLDTLSPNIESFPQKKYLFLHSPTRIAIFILTSIILIGSLILLAKITIEKSRTKKAEILYNEACKFLDDNPGPLSKIKKKLEMFEKVKKTKDKKFSQAASAKISEIVENAKNHKKKLDTMKKQSEFEEVRIKAYELQKSGQIDKAIYLFEKLAEEPLFQNDPIFTKQIEREIEYLKRLKEKNKK